MPPFILNPSRFALMQKFPNINPYMWFHGTNTNFENFWINNPRNEVMDTLLGVHFASLPQTAEKFLMAPESSWINFENKNWIPQIRPVMIQGEYPKIYNNEHLLQQDFSDFVDKFLGKERMTKDSDLGDFPNPKYTRQNTEDFKTYLQKQGHDSVLYGNIVEPPYLNSSLIAFNAPEQAIPLSNFPSPLPPSPPNSPSLEAFGKLMELLNNKSNEMHFIKTNPREGTLYSKLRDAERLIGTSQYPDIPLEANLRPLAQQYTNMPPNRALVAPPSELLRWVQSIFQDSTRA